MLPIIRNREGRPSLLNDWPSIFDDFYRAFEAPTTNRFDKLNLPVDVIEDEDGYRILADVPGVSKEDLDVSIEQNLLTLSVKRQSEKLDKETELLTSRWQGVISRSFTLPSSIDESKVKASLKDGVLTVNVAKKAESKCRRIAVN